MASLWPQVPELTHGVKQSGILWTMSCLVSWTEVMFRLLYCIFEAYKVGFVEDIRLLNIKSYSQRWHILGSSCYKEC